jgi:hypothetical protein
MVTTQELEAAGVQVHTAEAKVLNTCPHNINIFPEDAFINLKQINPTTWVADGVKEEAPLLAFYPSSGSSLRIGVESKPIGSIAGVPCYRAVYGELSGLPEEEYDVIITSLPAVSNAKLKGLAIAEKLCSPHQVVRLSTDTSVILGCTGLQFQ